MSPGRIIRPLSATPKRHTTTGGCICTAWRELKNSHVKVIRPIQRRSRQRCPASAARRRQGFGNCSYAEAPRPWRSLIQTGGHHSGNRACAAGVVASSHLGNDFFRRHIRYNPQHPTIIFHRPLHRRRAHARRRESIVRSIMRQVAAGEINRGQSRGRHRARRRIVPVPAPILPAGLRSEGSRASGQIAWISGNSTSTACSRR